ncbi:hypothetical protein DQ04_04861020 [Trypanosoma grayi]|uniref:hypothetical protein n=1 Tax=Trypanosoma grayi TaxID=71804 RepID=UPI0004F4284C|nr:hypothetical protein DQ04_04861020 [Trypanosoma grayi]KEG09654.1 hypothetical protein DQ04_04861020 [Trypanosoma grayi]
MAANGTATTNVGNSNSNNGSSKSPYICLSAHCDLLHFVGQVPHPYGGPTPVTLKERAARYLRFSCGSLEHAPSVSVRCNHPLFLPIPIEAEADGQSSFPLSGVGLALYGFQENFEAAVVESGSALTHQNRNEDEKQQNEKSERHNNNHSANEDSLECPNESTLPSHSSPSSEAQLTSSEDMSRSSVVNPFAVRRTLLQALFILNLPKRSPAASFTLCTHDPSPNGATTFLVLPRSAEHVAALAHPVKVMLAVRESVTGTVLQCSCDMSSSSNRHLQRVDDENGVTCSLLFWELEKDTGGVATTGGALGLDVFLTNMMLPSLFTIPLRFQLLAVAQERHVSQVVGWSQRRSFHLLALIAHCVWCEKVADHIMHSTSGATVVCRSCTAQLKPREDASLDSSDKWETTLRFRGVDAREGSKDDVPCHAGLLQVAVRGCDEQLCWWWGDVALQQQQRGDICALEAAW